MKDIAAYLQWGEMVHWILIAFGCIMILVALSRRQLVGVRTNTFALTVILAIVLVHLIGCYPIPFGAGADRDMYAGRFLRAAALEHFVKPGKDAGFAWLTFVLSRICDLTWFFIVLACLYVANYVWACKRLSPQGCFWLMAAVVLSMGFVSYGMNTLRAGLALSLVLVGMTYESSKIKMAVLLFVATLIHFSTIIPILMIVLTYFYKNTNTYLKLWLLAVIVSFVAGDYFNHLFQDFSDDARTGYLTQVNKNYRTGFRIDFIIYSVIPIIMGVHYKKRMLNPDPFYSHLLNAYIMTNVFWVLVIRANFSDRFAYLSWFMIPFVLVYPLLKDKPVVQYPARWLAAIFAGDVAFMLLFG